jgi:hypothetical protein
MIYMALSRLTGSNFSAEWRRMDDSACFPAFTGVEEIAADRRVLGSTDTATWQE